MPGEASPIAPPPAGSNLRQRIISAFVLIPAALGAAYLGGPAFAVFWLIAALAVLWEWNSLLGRDGALRTTLVGGGVIVAATLLVLLDYVGPALGLVALDAILIAALSSRDRGLHAASVPYAAAIVLAPLILRLDASGLAAILLLFVVVWLTDIVAYFAGRAIGGPKLLPSVSPKKTWSGAIAGTAGAVAGGVALLATLGAPRLLPLAMVCTALSVASQAGDLFESALKRRVGAKESGSLIPGHGGVMDRLDGFVAAAALAALIGIARDGLEAPSRGLLIW
jgi:phosphatidate cytidylyltransferase